MKKDRVFANKIKAQYYRLAVFAAGMALCLLGKRQVENKRRTVLFIMQFFLNPPSRQKLIVQTAEKIR